MIRALPWLLAAALAIAAVVLGYQLREARLDQAHAQQSIEAAELEAEGIPVVEVVPRDELERRILALEEELAEPLARVRRVSPGARPIAVMSASTGPVVASGEPRPETPAPTTDAQPQLTSEPPPRCLVAEGDLVETHVDEAHLETRSGVTVVVGSTSTWREEPTPRTRFARGYLLAPLTEVAMAEKPRTPSGWGGGIWARASLRSSAAGAHLLPPPLRVLGVSVESTIGLGAGTDGLETLAMVGARF